MDNSALIGIVLFLGVLAFPLAAVALPFVDLWYGRNKEKVNKQVSTVKTRVEELREKRDSAYAEDEAARADEDTSEEDESDD